MNESQKATALLATILTFQLACHLVSIDKVFMNDEGTHITGGWLLERGMVPYKEFALLQYLPGAAILASVSFSILGPELQSAKLFIAGVMLLSTAMVFLIARRLYGNYAALVASFFFALLAPPFGSLMFMPEPIMTLLVLVLFWLLSKSDKEGGIALLMASGTVCALIVLMKIPGLAVLFASIAFLMARAYLKKERAARFASDIGLLLLGFAIPLAILFLWFSHLGVLDDVYSQVIFQLLFRTQEKLLSDPADIALNLILVLIPVAYLPTVSRDLKKGKMDSVILFLLALASLYSIIIRFQPNRVLYALPLLSIMGGAIFEERIGERERRFILGFGVILASVTLAAVSLWGGESPGTEEMEEFVLTHTSLSDKILIVPYGHVYYFLMKREPGYRYLGLGPWGQPDDTEQNAVADLVLNRPKVIIYSKKPQWGKEFWEYEPLIDKYIWDNYEITGENQFAYFMEPKK
ncbi:MAG: glycosyltransferase family 39 protein [Candidatus Micrarchaeota archaeon]